MVIPMLEKQHFKDMKKANEEEPHTQASDYVISDQGTVCISWLYSYYHFFFGGGMGGWLGWGREKEMLKNAKCKNFAPKTANRPNIFKKN